MLKGLQPIKSLLGPSLWHSKNLATQQIAQNFGIITSNNLYGMTVSQYLPWVALSNDDLSYQIYKTISYESGLVKFKLNRLVAVIYMKDFEFPVFEEEEPEIEDPVDPEQPEDLDID